MGRTRTIEIAEPLFETVERLTIESDTSPAEFIEAAVAVAVEAKEQEHRFKQWDRELAESYRKLPQTADEIGEWDDVQAWGDP